MALQFMINELQCYSSMPLDEASWPSDWGAGHKFEFLSLDPTLINSWICFG